MDLSREREFGPRFPARNTFEFVYGMKWKELYEIEKQRRAQLEDELREARRRLEADMELAYQDYQAQMLREDLQRRQQELERLEAARRERLGMRAAAGGPGGPPGHGPGMMVPPQFGQPGFGPPMGGYQPYPQGGPTGPGGPGGPGGPPGPGGASQGPGGPGGPGGPEPGSQRQPQTNNMLEGVQRLLQIFKNDQPGQPRPGSGPGPYGAPGGPGGPPPGAPYVGGPGGPGDYPPEKRMRR